MLIYERKRKELEELQNMWSEYSRKLLIFKERIYRICVTPVKCEIKKKKNILKKT